MMTIQCLDHKFKNRKFKITLTKGLNTDRILLGFPLKHLLKVYAIQHIKQLSQKISNFQTASIVLIPRNHGSIEGSSTELHYYYDFLNRLNMGSWNQLYNFVVLKIGFCSSHQNLPYWNIWQLHLCIAGQIDMVVWSNSPSLYGYITTSKDGPIVGIIHCCTLIQFFWHYDLSWSIENKWLVVGRIIAKWLLSVSSEYYSISRFCY